jgi:hypothetical protein
MPRRPVLIVLALALALAWAASSLAPSGSLRAQGPAAQDSTRVRPNYELASRWTASKVNNKLVFSVSVTPNWIATGDRFWYTFSTSKGPRWMLVDAVKRTKAPLFDPAAMAAQLTSIVRVPFDSGHLPLSAVRLIKKDAVLQFEVAVPKDTKIPGIVEKGEDKETTEDQQQRGGGRGGPPPGAAAAPAGPTRNLRFEYDLATGKLTLVHPDEVRAQAEKDKEAKWPSWASVSPDEKVAVFVRKFDLHMMDAENLKKAIKDPRDPSIVETRLTTDGEEYYAYSRHVSEDDKDRLRKEQKKEEKKEEVKKDEKAGEKQDAAKQEAAKKAAAAKDEKDTFEPRVAPAGVVWSQDSKRFTAERSDARKVKDLWVIDSLAQPRPKLETYRYSMPGEDIAIEELQVFEVAGRQRTPVKCDAFKDQRLSVAMRRVTDMERRDREGTPNPIVSPQWALAGSDSFLVTRQSRDLKRLDILRVDAKTGEVKTLVEERMNTYIDTRPIRVLEGEQEFLWWSERDGWGHWYLYGIDGTLKNQVTKGEFVTGNIAGLDEKTRTLYVTANAREAGEDPYYEHLYRVGLDGSGFKLLNPGDANHAVVMAEHTRVFVDTTSRVDQAPKSVLRDSLGNQLTDLETTDTSLLCELGYKFP